MAKGIFERGDVISDLIKKDIRVILDKKDGSYECLNLLNISFRDIFNTYYTIEKGSLSSQPYDNVDKYFCLLDLRNLSGL